MEEVKPKILNQKGVLKRLGICAFTLRKWEKDGIIKRLPIPGAHYSTEHIDNVANGNVDADEPAAVPETVKPETAGQPAIRLGQ